ncbi:MAG: dihydroorotate dehydrogenase electron transfer subunit [Candidatus Magasanikbacteria bacterium]
MDKPTFLKISKITNENPFVKTFYFDHPLDSKPGQFVMLWIPGLDQKPFSIAYDDGQSFGLSIFKRGPTTEKLFGMSVGDRVGISGPYGTSFTVNPKLRYIMVAGGYGAAPLGCLAEALANCHSEQHNCHPEPCLPAGRRAKRVEGSPIDFIAGSRNKDLLLFKDRLSKIPNLNLHITTDDGSAGHKGFVTDLLPDLIQNVIPAKAGIQSPVLVVTCGPEIMQKKVLDICNQYDVDCEVSIERYMKCGVGVCGQCTADPIGICLCQEGPVVKRAIANQITEFGKYHRDKSGAIISF